MPAFVTKLPLSVTAASGSATSLDLPKVDDDTMHSFVHRHVGRADRAEWHHARGGRRPPVLAVAVVPGAPGPAGDRRVRPGVRRLVGADLHLDGTGGAEFAGPQLFVRGLASAPADVSQVKGIEVLPRGWTTTGP